MGVTKYYELNLSSVPPKRDTVYHRFWCFLGCFDHQTIFHLLSSTNTHIGVTTTQIQNTYARGYSIHRDVITITKTSVANFIFHHFLTFWGHTDS